MQLHLNKDMMSVCFLYLAESFFLYKLVPKKVSQIYHETLQHLRVPEPWLRLFFMPGRTGQLRAKMSLRPLSDWSSAIT